MNKDEKATFVPGKLKMKATAALETSVAEDLNVPDPDKDTAKAILREGSDDSDS